jgi:dCTP deaminase
MILNDSEIIQESLLSPFCNRKIREANGIKRISYGCSSFGYDITLSDSILQVFKPGKLIDPKNFNEDCLDNLVLISDDSGDYFILPPYSNALGVSRELFDIPSDVVGVAVGKSTYARCGVIVNITPLEPSWKGFLVLEIFNANNSPCKIYANEGIAQILFLKGNKPLQEYSGHYQNQENRITYAKV